MSLDEFKSDLEKYAPQDAFSASDSKIEMYPDEFKSSLSLMEHLCEAVHPYKLQFTPIRNGTIEVTEGDPVRGSKNVDGFVENNQYVIDRETYEQKYVDKDRMKVGGDEIYIEIMGQPNKKLVETLIESFKYGLYPAGYDLDSSNSPNIIILGKPAN